MQELNTPRSMEQMEALRGQLGVTPRGTITNADVRTVTLQKAARNDRLGLVFYPVTDGAVVYRGSSSDRYSSSDRWSSRDRWNR